MELLVEGIKKNFEKKEVLKGLNYNFDQGRIYALLGRNGSGKTTFFNCLNEDLKSDSGNFWLVENGVKNKLSFEDIGYVLSTPTVPEFLTGREFLKFFIEANHIANPMPLDGYFEYVKIGPDDRDKLLKDYSHGMKNKMQMLVNIIAKPKILLLDEPLTSLDVVVAEEMKQLLRTIKSNHIIIFSTHILELALSLCDEIVVLNKGVLTKIDDEGIGAEDMKIKILEALGGEEDA